MMKSTPQNNYFSKTKVNTWLKMCMDNGKKKHRWWFQKGSWHFYRNLIQTSIWRKNCTFFPYFSKFCVQCGCVSLLSMWTRALLHLHQFYLWKKILAKRRMMIILGENHQKPIWEGCKEMVQNINLNHIHFFFTKNFPNNQF